MRELSSLQGKWGFQKAHPTWSNTEGYSESGHARSRFGLPYLFTGQRLDPESGLNYFKNRFFDSAIGKFMSRDLLGYADGANLYRYARANPIGGTDPFGLRNQDLRSAYDAAITEHPLVKSMIVTAVEKKIKSNVEYSFSVVRTQTGFGATNLYEGDENEVLMPPTDDRTSTPRTIDGYPVVLDVHTHTTNFGEQSHQSNAHSKEDLEDLKTRGPQMVVTEFGMYKWDPATMASPMRVLWGRAFKEYSTVPSSAKQPSSS